MESKQFEVQNTQKVQNTLKVQRSNIREIRVVKPATPRRGLTRKYTFIRKPKLVNFLPYYDLVFLCQEKGVQNLSAITRAEMCESLNIIMKPQTKRLIRRKRTPVHTCAEKPTEIELCCVRRLRHMARAGGIRNWFKMTKKQLCAALNVVFKI